MSLFVWGHWHFPSVTLMGNRPTFVCQQSAQKTFLQMLFYVLLLICLCCILDWCLFCSADGIQLREKNKTCVMPSQHPIRHAADNFPCPTFSSSGPCWVLTKRIQWPPYPLDQKRQVLALPPFTRQHIFTWSVGQNSIFYFVWKMSLYASIRVHNLHSFNFSFVFREAEKVVNLFTCILIGLEGGRRKVCKTVELWFFFVFISFFCVLC